MFTLHRVHVVAASCMQPAVDSHNHAHARKLQVPRDEIKCTNNNPESGFTFHACAMR